MDRTSWDNLDEAGFIEPTFANLFLQELAGTHLFSLRGSTNRLCL